MKRFPVLSLLLLLAGLATAQMEQQNWVLGYYRTLHFDGTTITELLDSKMLQPEAVMCANHPKTGELLFYSDGRYVWNRNHQEMNLSQPLRGGYSSQSGLVVPLVNDTNRYYLITTTHWGGPSYYSIVDMRLDNGLGGIDSNEINVLIADDMSEKLAITHHADGKSYWLLQHETNSGRFFAFRLDKNGFSAPVITKIGMPITEDLGRIRFSPDGSRLVSINYDYTVKGYVELMRFDRQTGKLWDARTVDTLERGYSAEFSPDGSKLYVCSPYDGLFQLDLSSDSIPQIGQSQYRLGTGNGTIQRHPNGSIYIIKIGSYYLERIAEPNEPGALCMYDSLAFRMHNVAQWGLPDIIEPIPFSPPAPLVPVSPHLPGQWHLPSPNPTPPDDPVDSMRMYNCGIRPNPTPDILHIDLAPDWSLVLDVAVFDSGGNRVHTFERGIWGGSVNVQRWDPGVYNLVYFYKQGTNCCRFIVAPH